MSSQPLFNQNHGLGTLLSLWKEYPRLDEELVLIASSVDEDGLDVATIAESRYFPFYAVLFHPERASTDFSRLDVNHSEEAIQATLAMGNFFVDESRKNSRTFKDMKELSKLLTENDRHWFGHSGTTGDVVDTYAYNRA